MHHHDASQSNQILNKCLFSRIKIFNDNSEDVRQDCSKKVDLFKDLLQKSKLTFFATYLLDNLIFDSL